MCFCVCVCVVHGMNYILTHSQMLSVFRCSLNCMFCWEGHRATINRWQQIVATAVATEMKVQQPVFDSEGACGGGFMIKLIQGNDLIYEICPGKVQPLLI